MVKSANYVCGDFFKCYISSKASREGLVYARHYLEQIKIHIWHDHVNLCNKYYVPLK